VRKVITIAATCGALLLLQVGSASATFPGANGKIAFNGFDGADYDVYSVNPDGSGLTLLTAESPADEIGPAWSPDGRKIAFYSNRDDPNPTSCRPRCTYDVYVMNADGSGVTRLTDDPAQDRGPAWSPDGQRIVFFSYRSPVGLYVMSADGSNETALGPGDSNPAWSPLGDKIAFADIDLWTVRPDGSDMTMVIENKFSDRIADVGWTPDARKIVLGAYFVTHEGQVCDVYTINPDGSQLELLPNAEADDVTWSPDGTKLALSPCGIAPPALYVQNADGSGRVGPIAQGSNPDWQPIVRNYPRPKGASTEWVSLVPAYKPCNSPNSTHGTPLAAGSCNPPVQASDYLTVGSADSNGKPTKSTSQLLLLAQPGDPTTAADEADMKITYYARDVRNKSDLSDYTGELQAEQSVKITDKYNGYGGGSATAQDIPYSYTIPCASTTDTTIGASCDLTTTADTLVPGTIGEGKRAVWELGQLRVFDGGSDGLASTAAGNTLFEVQGIFVP
jgi:Tol biopolymer transport system component